MRLNRRPGAALAVLAGAVVVLSALTGCGQQDGGTLRAVSDTGRGAYAIDEGWVLTLPTNDDASWELLDTQPEAELERVRVPVESADVTSLGGTWQPVESGRFALPTDLVGEHLLCWAVPPDSGPATAVLRGCAVLGLKDGSRVEATWGEAGFRAEIE